MRCPYCGNNLPVEAEIRDVQQDKVYGVKQWFGTMLLMLIPGVNLILLFIWAFSGKVNKNKKNWAIAAIFIYAIVILILVALYFMLVSMVNRLLGG
ncbi:hypothetical protein Cst_c24610 [Thermoclostridium stercorarium subsp. stercorarium DSM 8532]|jgi:NADH:ubiquinone oxidoreductase subunit 3 (subunit A)|uniref:Uncharacterized protein n=3 Tax=Thermoclostridium stercorarium TaxID=1510 RepID=L7VSR4_THES1|nr:hypothetical protein [Thermoclostridium stercorarium]AGC69421.1 hypothetical protein Cst_c24610 [Thermoclostridium stercorarium subsp. stercorarium DSM 8532]AGI40379.1 hypothetical protein Clst_2356 [Thermoclostridium stercorarium subsp. stercorarium DSM 8532]ANW99670.1 hypothetical protein CSTERTH_11795 [Thermoclostridium stercorarium subsp. thermolacticum DSM 2910]ANX02296.1 hypothetical protein CSTERLE_12290 [Thermoclostridium stercorarium subsp. leptospartum DSM 9219]UZQ85374.1 hypothet